MNPTGTESTVGDTPGLEIALLRRGLGDREEAAEHCDSCQRTVLIGERVYEYGAGEVRCALCRDRHRESPIDSHIVHGPAFGHSIRVLDRRPFKHAA
jgi:LSD1 subclass zinc finger protein